MVLLGMHPNQLVAFLVLEHEFVVAVMALRGVRLGTGLGFLTGQIVGHLVVAIVDASGHKRPVGIAFEEFDDHFHADAGNELSAPLLARPDLGYANRAGFLRFPIPVELDPDMPVLVGRDFLAVLSFFADHLCRLDSENSRFRCQRQTSKWTIAWKKLIGPVVANGAFRGNCDRKSGCRTCG